MSRIEKWTVCGLLLAIVTICVPAVLACIPTATGNATMEMSEIVVDVTQELPGGG